MFGQAIYLVYDRHWYRPGLYPVYTIYGIYFVSDIYVIMLVGLLRILWTAFHPLYPTPLDIPEGPHPDSCDDEDS